MRRNEGEGERGISKEESRCKGKSHLNGKNIFVVVNNWTVPVKRNSAAFLDWTKEVTKEFHPWTQKQ